MTRKEFAERLHVSVSTVSRMRRDGVAVGDFERARAWLAGRKRGRRGKSRFPSRSVPPSSGRQEDADNDIRRQALTRLSQIERVLFQQLDSAVEEEHPDLLDVKETLAAWIACASSLWKSGIAIDPAYPGRGQFVARSEAEHILKTIANWLGIAARKAAEQLAHRIPNGVDSERHVSEISNVFQEVLVSTLTIVARDQIPVWASEQFRAGLELDWSDEEYTEQMQMRQKAFEELIGQLTGDEPE